jgi:hypothetical protein
MATVAVGGAIMAVALTVFAAGIAASLLPARQPLAEPGRLTVNWGGVTPRPVVTAWVGPVSVLLIVAAMYTFTAVGFELMQSLPVAGNGAGGH